MRVKFSAVDLRKRLRRGTTIVEVVVAMFIIILLSGVGIGACYTALNVQTNAVKTVFACNVSQEFISAFNGAANSPDFTEEFEKRIVFALDCGEDKLTVSEDKSTYVYSSSGITVNATITEFKGNRIIAVTGRVNKLSKVVYTNSATATIPPAAGGAEGEGSSQAAVSAQAEGGAE